MGNRVQRVKTEVSYPEMSQSMIESWRELFHGETPSKEQVSLVMAQNALETGNRKSMYNYNIGNLTTNGNGPFNFYDDLTTDEQVKPGKWEKKNLKYRAYNSLNEGTKDYLKMLSGNKYGRAWEHIVNPDPIAFSKALKNIGYYTANEAPYTKTLTNLYNKFSKTDKFKPEIVQPKNDNNINQLLNGYLQMVAASNNHLYKKYLPNNIFTIQVNAEDYTNGIEFSRILCTALDEELYSKSFIHTSNNKIEIECIISGPAKECFESVKQLTSSISEAFKIATTKIGGVEIITNVMNKKSSYQIMNLKSAEIQYRKFLLKFI